MSRINQTADELRVRAIISACKGCRFLSKDGCNFLGATGRSRRCPPGADCIVRENSITHSRNQIDWQTGLALYSDGASDGAIARSIKCRRESVAAWRVRNGLCAN
ncbi:MAG: hypothetical protein RSC00_07895 [Ruthenibacterium sp.]